MNYQQKKKKNRIYKIMKIISQKSRSKLLIKYTSSFLMVFLILSCQSNNYKQFKPLDGGTWNIMVIKSHDKYLVGNAEYQIVYGNYLYINFKHKKILIEFQNKKIQGDFKIKKNGENYKFVIFNTSDSLFNKEYELVLDTINKSTFSTQYNLLLRTNDLLIASKKIQMGIGVN